MAAMATLSLNAKYNSIPKESPILTKFFRSLQSEIQTKLERIFVSGGSDISTTKDAMLVFQINKNKDMVLVSVVPLTKH